MKVDAACSLKVPDTWTPIFDLSDPEKNLKILEHARMDLETIIEKIKERATGDFERAKLPAFTRKPARFFYDRARKTDHFEVSDACVGCHLCKSSAR